MSPLSSDFLPSDFPAGTAAAFVDAYNAAAGRALPPQAFIFYELPYSSSSYVGKVFDHTHVIFFAVTLI